MAVTSPSGDRDGHNNILARNIPRNSAGREPTRIDASSRAARNAGGKHALLPRSWYCPRALAAGLPAPELSSPRRGLLSATSPRAVPPRRQLQDRIYASIPSLGCFVWNQKSCAPIVQLFQPP